MTDGAHAGASACRRCGRDLSGDPIKYEADDGRILCEGCFRATAEWAAAPPPAFLLLRGAAWALRIIAVLALAGGAIAARLGGGPGGGIRPDALLAAALVFLSCVVLSELARLGLAVHGRLGEIGARLARLEDALRGPAGGWPGGGA
ncbi:MAG: hypothetical protein PHN82_09195 [bacterium]|nr:hypothetical protein [bacterium]